MDLQLLTWLHSTKDRGQGASYDRLWRNTCNAKDTGRKRKSRIWQNNVVLNLKNFSLVLQQVKTTKLTCKFRKYTIVNKSNVYRINPGRTSYDEQNDTVAGQIAKITFCYRVVVHMYKHTIESTTTVLPHAHLSPHQGKKFLHTHVLNINHSSTQNSGTIYFIFQFTKRVRFRERLDE